MKDRSSKSRRHFVKKLAGGMLAAPFGASTLMAQGEAQLIQPRAPISYSSNDRIRVAAIGMGIMGFNNCRTALKVPGVELVAVCDLYDGHFVKAVTEFGDHLITTRDYKSLLDREDIDAVIISTPDHWHDKIAMEAMEKGKAVYCEKPMVHKIEEGAAIIATQKKTGMVMQVGSQRVSSILFQKAKTLYEEGVIGPLVLVETWTNRQSALGAWQYSIPPDASEKSIDWNRFLGSAPQQAFDPVRFFRWRNYQDYGTGVAGDLFVHLFSGLHVVTSSLGPNRIFATGGLRYWKDGRDVPDVMIACCDYPETKQHPAFNLQIKVNFIDGGGGGSALRLIGTEGVMEIGWNDIKIKKSQLPAAPGYGGWDTFNTFTAATQMAFEKEYKAKYGDLPTPQEKTPEEIAYRVPEGYSDHYDHFLNFFNAIRGKEKEVEDSSFGLRAAAPSLAANLSYFQNKAISWDPVQMKLV
ncbi:MAG: Gfo/Idh/MocA family oxidoreductase [Bacteroidota bacterium]